MKLVSLRSVVLRARFSRRGLLLVAVTTSLALAFSGVSGPASAEGQKLSSGSSKATEKVTSRPDRVSAMSTARAQKSSVEDLSARTATTSVFANSDGTWTTKSFGGPVRAKNAAGAWVDLDSTVSKQGDHLGPKVSAYDVKFSGGGDKTIASVHGEGSDEIGVGWPDKLPKPTVDGKQLTYRGVVPNGDLVVQSQSSGFEYSVVLNKAPDPDADPLELRIPLKTDGATASVSDDGSVAIKHGKTPIATMSAPVMFDSAKSDKTAKVDADRLHAVKTSVDSSGDSPILVLKPDMAFLTDPATTYPVEIDPTVTMYAAGDTWVQSSGDTSSQTASAELHVGSNDGGTTAARSFIYFDVGTSLAGVQHGAVTSAQVSLSNFETGACAGSQLTMSRVTGSWNGGNFNWATQPAITSAGASHSSQAHGATGCADEGTVTFDATQIAKDWFAGQSILGVQIAADDETAASGWRKFRSADNTDPTRAPMLTLTMNSYPNVPSALQVTPASSDGSTFITASNKPTFSAIMSDPDGGTVTPEFGLVKGTTTIEDSGLSPVPSGGTATHVSANVLSDGTYGVSWRASDGALASAWSPQTTVVVDTVPPAAPTVACTSTAVNTWYDTRPATTSTCTITAASGTAGVSATLNGVNVDFPALSGGTTSKAFTLPTNGMFNLQVTAVDAAGNPATKGYVFGVGTGSLSSPTSGTSSTRAFTINATSKSGATSAQVQWRLAGNTTWVAATHVTQGLIPWSGIPSNVGTTSVTGDLNWNAADETGAITPSAVQVRFCFNYSGGTQRCTAVTPVNLVPHAFGGNFPTDDVGPASVSLQTGEFQLDSDDISVPGFGDDLGLSRTYQSYGSPASAAQGVFGDGWIANFDGPDEGFGAAQVVDHTSTNGTIALMDSAGGTAIYRFSSGGKTAQAVGVYKGQGEAAGFNEKLELAAGSPKTLKLTQSDGTVTTWKFAGSNTWLVASVADATAAPPTTYSYTTDNLVSGIYAGVPGVTCNSTTQDQGCHALLMTYATVGSAKRLSQVDLRTWDPAASSGAGAMTTTTVEKYSYDTSGG